MTSSSGSRSSLFASTAARERVDNTRLSSLRSRSRCFRASLPESLAEVKRVDDALRRHNLVSHEPHRLCVLQPWECFFDAFLDGWRYSGFTRLHEDVRSLRRALKKWCRDETNYQNLLRNKHNPAFESVIDEWLSEHPDIASKIAAAGSRAQHIKKQEWNNFCNGYALGGYTPQGTNPRMGDTHTCIAVANIYKATVQVHIGLEQPITFTPFDDVSYCTINLVIYCAKDWQHYRSTRPLTSSTSSPHTHNQETAPDVSALESSGAADALSVVRHHVAAPENGPASPPSSLDERNCSQDQLIQQQPPLRRVPALLDVSLLTAPFGSSDPFAFYRALDVARDATVDEINEDYKKMALHYHPDKHPASESVIWTSQIQILNSIRGTLINKEERHKYDSQSGRASRIAARDALRDVGRASSPPQRRERGRYNAREHSATKAVIDHHLETIARLFREGKALEEDVANMQSFVDVYDKLPPRPDGLQEGEHWDS